MSKVVPYILAVVVLFSGCTKEIELEPFVYPQFLKNELEFVEVFDDGGFLAYSNEGLFVKMDDANEFVITPNQSDFYARSLNQMEYFKTPSKLYGVNNLYIMEFEKGDISFYDNDLATTGGNVTSYTSYGLNNDGDLCVAYYGALRWTSSFYYDHQLYFGKWSNEYWEVDSLSLWVSDTLLHIPGMAFGEDKFYISVGDIYEIDPNDFDFDKIVPNFPNEYVNMHHLHVFENVLYGQSTWIHASPSTQTYSLNLNSGEFNYTEIDDICPFTSQYTYLGRILQNSEGEFHYYMDLENFFGDTEDGNYRRLRHNKEKCKEVTIDFEDGNINFVYEVDYHKPSNSLYMATDRGLKIISLDNGSFSDYLPELIVR